MIADLISPIQNIRKGLVLGLSIEPSNIKIIGLARHGMNWELHAFVSKPLSLDPHHHKDANHLDEYLAHSLRLAWQSLGTRHQEIAISIAQRYVVTRTVNLPDNLQPFDLEIALLAQAEKMLPFTVSDIAMDYKLHADTAKSATLVVCQKQQITRLANLAVKAGLKLVAVEDENTACARGAALRQAHDSEPKILRPRHMDQQTWQQYDSRYDVACGVAVGGEFNLMPWREKILRQKNLIFGTVAILIVLCAQIPMGIRQINMNAQNQKIMQDTQNMIVRTAHLKTRIADYTHTKQIYQKQHERHQALTLWSNANGWLEQILQQLPNSVPEKMHLEQLRLTTPISEIRGYAESPSDISVFASQMARIPAISKAELSEIRVAENGLGNKFSVRLWIDL